MFKRGCQQESINKGYLSYDFMLKNGLFLSQSLSHLLLISFNFQNIQDEIE